MGRHSRYRRGRAGRTGSVGFLPMLMALVLAVTVGYAGTKHIVYPLLLDNQGGGTVNEEDVAKPKEEEENIKPPDEVAASAQSNPTTGITENVITDGQNVKTERGYTLQYGTFADKSAAGNLAGELSQKGINVYIYETASEFRVMGNAYESKEKAESAVQIIKGAGIETSLVEY